MIDLAPGHKVGLTLSNPVMPAAGCFGFGGEYAHLVRVEALGAVIVGPVTAERRPGAAPPRIVPLPGGALVHSGLANPGLSALVRRRRRVWAGLPTPLIVHVAGVSPDEAARCCERLAGIEEVAGVELGLPDAADLDEAEAIIRAACAAALQPVIVRLPLASAEWLCGAVVAAGASALTVAAPPRGTVWCAAAGRFISGRLYGSFVLPLALRALRRTVERVNAPLIGCGGVHSVEDARAFLRAGAVAVQVDSALWRDPACLARIAEEILLDPLL